MNYKNSTPASPSPTNSSACNLDHIMAMQIMDAHTMCRSKADTTAVRVPTAAIKTPKTLNAEAPNASGALANCEFKVLDTFIHTIDDAAMRVVLCCNRNNQLCITGTPDLDEDPRKVDLATWDPTPIDVKIIHTNYTPCIMTKVDNAKVANLFVKRPDYVQLLTSIGLDIVMLPYLGAQIMSRDVEMNEMLKMWPHPNIATYLGVEVSNEIRFRDSVVGSSPHQLVTGLCFEQYECTLGDLVLRREHIDVSKAIADIEAGIRHMHSLGFVHCDIKPDNIFYKDGNFVFGDFDSVHPVGALLRLKWGTKEWSDIPPGTAAEFFHDLDALNRVEKWLFEYTEERKLELENAPYWVAPRKMYCVERSVLNRTGEYAAILVMTCLISSLALWMPTGKGSLFECLFGNLEEEEMPVHMRFPPPVPNNTRVAIAEDGE